MARLNRADGQKPLAPGSAARWQANDAQTGQQKSTKRQGHRATEPPHVADLGFMSRHVNGTRTKEQRDLADRMHRNVHAATDDTVGRRQGGA